MRENPRAVRDRVGRNIRRLRLQRRWSQEQLAERAGKNHKHIGQIERGEVNVSLDTLTAIAGGLSASIGDLVGSAIASDEPPARPYAMTRRRAQQIERAEAKLRRLKQAAKRR